MLTRKPDPKPQEEPNEVELVLQNAAVLRACSGASDAPMNHPQSSNAMTTLFREGLY